MEKIVNASTTETVPAKKSTKCVVWDLDNTLWDGVLLEDDEVKLRDEVMEVIKTLDARGILHSIASKNDPEKALSKLKDLAIDHYFLYPQVSWNSKVGSIEAVAKSINIGLDAIAFIDDQPYELEEVKFSLPQVSCINAVEIGSLLEMPELNPRFITDDSRKRREMYLSDIVRNTAEEEYVGPKEEFLATLDMVCTIMPAQEEDLKRAEELTVRTNQLNTTGYTYSYEELDQFRRSDQHLLFVASLEDKFGTYGKIGLALVERLPEIWTIKLLLMSCRVMSRGIGNILLIYIMRLAGKHHARLHSEFVSNERNRMMYVAYKFAGFKEISKSGDVAILESDLTRARPFPDYVKIHLHPDYGLD